MDIVRDDRLIGDAGRPLFGLHEGPIRDLSLERFRLHGQPHMSAAKNEFIRDFQLKRWQFMGVCAPGFVLGAAIVDAGYLSNAFAYLFERDGGRITEFASTRPLAAQTEFSASPLGGKAGFKSGKASILMENAAESLRLRLDLPNGLEADLSFSRGIPSLSLVTRVGLSRFNYTNKESCLEVSGSLCLEGRKIASGEGLGSGIVDFTFGYLARYTFWNWASASGSSEEGARLGFNFAQGVNETGQTENAFWADGRLVKVDLVDFSYDDLDPLSPWTLRSADGKVDLAFHPEGKRSSDLNIGLVSSRFRQPFGRWTGTLRDGRESWKADGLSGFVEEHESRW